jgi:hypothetical protein
VFKQAKIIHTDGFTTQELEAYRWMIYENLLDSAKGIIYALDRLSISLEDENNQVSYEMLTRRTDLLVKLD